MIISVDIGYGYTKGVGPGDLRFSFPSVVGTAEDIRFTTKGNRLYAIALGWPAKKMNIKSLNTRQQAIGTIKSITMLGHEGKLGWSRDENALTIQLPDKQPCEHAFAFKIESTK